MQCETPSNDPAATPTQPPADQLAGAAKYCSEILLDLIDIGCQMARMVLHEIQSATVAAPAGSTATPAQDGTVAYERIARAVRRTVMLHNKLMEPKKIPSNRHRVAARRRIIRDVEDAIQHKAPEDEQETLHAELLERLDSPDLDAEIANRSIGEIVTDICRDFGIAGLDDTHPWKRRIPRDIAMLNLLAEQLPGAARSVDVDVAAAPPPPPPGQVTQITGSNPPISPDIDIASLPDEVFQAILARLKRWT